MPVFHACMNGMLIEFECSAVRSNYCYFVYREYRRVFYMS